MTSTTVPTVDIPALTGWMDKQEMGPRGAPVSVRFISGGSQNEVFEVTRGDFRSVLRIPPATAPTSRDAGILREWRIIEALEGTDVPHTPAIAVCEDPSVLGRTFYLMGFVDGWSAVGDDLQGWPAPFDTDLEARKGLAYELVNGIGLLSKVDWRSKGLQDLGRPDGFHDRQVDRWLHFLDRVRTREINGLDEATDWLRSHRPIDYIPGLMHGDYQFANVMYRHGGPAELAAIIDWEMGTVGDPKLDLAWVVQVWPDSGESKDGSIGGYVDIEGMPSRSELLAHYVDVTGRQVDDIDYYMILARWKLAIVLEQGYRNADGDPKLESFGEIVQQMMTQAAELAASTDYR